MTEKEVKEKLNNYRKLKKEIGVALQALENYNDQAAASGSLLPRDVKVKTSLPLSARFEEIIADKVELEKAIDESLELLKIYKQQASELILLAPDPAQRLLLTMRYINCMNWDDIARRMNYSSRHLRNMHNRAIKKISFYFL